MDPEQLFVVPTGLSFVFRIDPLAPDYSRQPKRAYPPQGYWGPPTLPNAYARTTGNLHRWRDGFVTPILHTDPAYISYTQATLELYSVMSLFAQVQTNNILGIERDCMQINMDRWGIDWTPLSFRHVGGMSSVELYENNAHLSAPATPNLMPQLLPEVYNYYQCSQDVGLGPPLQEGLCGKLSLLLALAAFSGPPEMLDSILTGCLRPGRWNSHSLHHGRTPERGLIVSVYLDPSPNALSTVTLLKGLEEGEFGAFYGP
ncbi:MAG: hypothetical protein M1837_002267 [Sclerophora amabilis]|nr:MAG: hypothetical protein M1837_002267 [Sclerophora amabilis]